MVNAPFIFHAQHHHGGLSQPPLMAVEIRTGGEQQYTEKNPLLKKLLHISAHFVNVILLLLINYTDFCSSLISSRRVLDCVKEYFKISPLRLLI